MSRAASIAFALLAVVFSLAAQDPSGLGAASLGEDSKVTAAAHFAPPAVRAGEVATLVVELGIEPGWHIYGSREETGQPTTLTITDAAGLELSGKPSVPPGAEHDAFGLRSYWLVGAPQLTQQLRVPADATPGELTVRGEVAYMACTEQMCDPPGATGFVAKLVVEAGPARPELTPAGGEGAGTAEPHPGAERAPGVKPGEKPEQGKAPATTPAERDSDSAGSAPGAGGTSAIAGADSQLEAMPLGLFLLAAIGWGLFALAMPCTYPMIPITISFFTKQASARGGRVAPMALLYGLGIVGMFVLIGVAVGNPIVLFAAHPITNLVIAALFFVFALVLFGVINLQPPQFLMRAASKASSQGGYVGVFLMGATLVVTSFTCTAPFVGSLLAIGGEGGDLGRVVLGMAVFGLTMAVPFVLLSLLPGKLQALPRSGEWMNTLKVFLGFVEIAAALKFLSNVDMVWQWRWLSRELFLSLWAGTFVLAGVFLAGMIKLKGETGEIGPGRLVGSLASLLLAAYCAYGALGNRMDWVMDAIAPPYHNRVVALAGSAGGSGEASASHDYIEDDYDAARRLAQQTGRKLLLNFTGVT